jgi:hypothetical protein
LPRCTTGSASAIPSPEVNPITLVVDAARALTLGTGDATGPALGALAWFAGLLAVFVPLTVPMFRER